MWIATFIPLIVTLSVISFLPAEVPMHYDAYGNIDRWGSKYEQLIFPVVTIGMSVFMQIMILFYEKSVDKTDDDKKRAELTSNINVLYIVSIATTIMFLVLQCVFLYMAWIATPDSKAQAVDINRVSGVMIGFILIIAGNYMPKTKRNSVVGFRTPITMKSDENWAKANRFAGIVLAITGVIIIVLGLVQEGFMIMLSTIMVVLISLVICMMYVKHMEHEEKNNEG